MKIIRINKEELNLDKNTIRKHFNLDSKDTDNEVYRVLIPVIPNTNYLPNIVETFIESKNRIKDFDSKYSFHCANHNVVNTIKQSILLGNISNYCEFEMPSMLTEG